MFEFNQPHIIIMWVQMDDLPLRRRAPLQNWEPQFEKHAYLCCGSLPGFNETVILKHSSPLEILNHCHRL